MSPYTTLAIFSYSVLCVVSYDQPCQLIITLGELPAQQSKVLHPHYCNSHVSSS